MEYTAVLAGERFSDAPRCVDPELAGILRHANDMLSDAERPALVPLLGRSIGLVIPTPDADRGRWHRLRRRALGSDGSGALRARLHASVSERFIAVVGLPPSRVLARWYGHHARLGELFWVLMSGPGSARASDDYAGRLVQRLDLLHRCYEESLAELGLPVRAADGASPAASTGTLRDRSAPSLPSR